MATALEELFKAQPDVAAATAPQSGGRAVRTARQLLTTWEFPADQVETLLERLPEDVILASAAAVEEDKSDAPKESRLYNRLLREIPRAKTQGRQRSAPNAAQAWLEIVRAVENYGPDQQPEFTHSAIADAVSFMEGWPKLRNQTDNYRVRDRFMKAYGDLV